MQSAVRIKGCNAKNSQLVVEIVLYSKYQHIEVSVMKLPKMTAQASLGPATQQYFAVYPSQKYVRDVVQIGPQAQQDEQQESYRMAKEYDAEIITEIFQSQVGDVGEGVCRAVVEYWLAANYDSAIHKIKGSLEKFYVDISNLGKGRSSMFTALQDDFKFHMKSKDLSVITLGRCKPTIASNKIYSLGQITFYFDELFPKDGFYYIGMEGHCFGLKKDKNYILFIDANTCEWKLKKELFKYKAFLVNYIATLYAGSVSKKLTTFFCFK